MIDFGPFIDPVLLDLIFKGAGIVGIVWIIWLLTKNQKTMVAGFAAAQHEPVMEAQALELERQGALLLAELKACKHEIALLKRLMKETDSNYEKLLKKYIGLLKRVDEIETIIADAGGVHKISLPGGMAEVHTGNTVRPPPIPRAPALKPQLSPLPGPVHKALQKNDSTVTKKVSTPPPPFARKPLKREE